MERQIDDSFVLVLFSVFLTWNGSYVVCLGWIYAFIILLSNFGEVRKNGSWCGDQKYDKKLQKFCVLEQKKSEDLQLQRLLKGGYK